MKARRTGGGIRVFLGVRSQDAVFETGVGSLGRRSFMFAIRGTGFHRYVRVGIVVWPQQVFKLFDEYILPLARPHNQFLVSSQNRGFGDVNGVDSVEQSSETVLRGVIEVVLQGHEEHRLFVIESDKPEA